MKIGNFLLYLAIGILIFSIIGSIFDFRLIIFSIIGILLRFLGWGLSIVEE